MPLDPLIIKTIQDIVAEIPFMTVADHLETILDNRKDSLMQKALDFFKETRLNNYQCSAGDELTFTITNTADQSVITLSNRPALAGEMRGEQLKKTLQDFAKKDPNRTILEAFTTYFQTTNTNTKIHSVKNMLTTEHPGMPAQLNAEQFDLLIEILRRKVEAQTPAFIQKYFDGDTPSCSTVRALLVLKPELINELYPNTNIQHLTDQIITYTTLFKELTDKANTLKKRGFFVDAGLLIALQENLHTRLMDFGVGKIDQQTFSEHCIDLLNTAQNSQLKEHRGILGSVFLKFITAGRASHAPTDTVKKINAIKSTLQSMTNPKTPENSEALASSSPTKSSI